MQIQNSQGLAHEWVVGGHLLIRAKNTPLVAARMLCNMLYDDLQPGSPSMAPSNGPWPSTCWCIYGVGWWGGGHMMLQYYKILLSWYSTLKWHPLLVRVDFILIQKARS